MQAQHGHVLKAARQKRALTQVQLSYHSGVAVGEISRIESRSLVPTRSTAIRLAEALGIPAEMLGGGDAQDVERGPT